MHFSLDLHVVLLPYVWCFRDAVLAVMMTAADLSNMLKPWAVHKEVVLGLYEEFWNQGDFEKLLGKQPLNIMDRDKRDQLPKHQVKISAQ